MMKTVMTLSNVWKSTGIAANHDCRRKVRTALLFTKQQSDMDFFLMPGHTVHSNPQASQQLCQSDGNPKGFENII